MYSGFKRHNINNMAQAQITGLSLSSTCTNSWSWSINIILNYLGPKDTIIAWGPTYTQAAHNSVSYYSYKMKLFLVLLLIYCTVVTRTTGMLLNKHDLGTV